MTNIAETKKACVKRTTFIGMVINILLACFKLVVGFIGNSQALIADGIHSLSDLTTDLAILFGVKYWVEPADSDHPYGHHKIELIVTAFITIVLVFVGVSILLKAIFSLNSDIPHEAPKLSALIVAIASIISKEWLYQYSVRQAEKIKSSAIKANAWHHRSDAISSIPVAIVIVASFFNPNLIFLDYVGAILVSIFILYPAFKMFADSISNLIDKSADKETISQITETAQKVAEVKSLHKIRTRKVGETIFVDMHIQVDKDITVKEGHDIAKTVKHKIMKANVNVLDVLIHIEPYEEK